LAIADEGVGTLTRSEHAVGDVVPFVSQEPDTAQ